MRDANSQSYAAFTDRMIDEATIQAYERDGAAIVRNLISPEWIEKMR